ncbi:uncharacterized protein BDCG_17003 [Blastomyces dermatitidis ER-3]|uniref:Uncharacterized protein n=1 Tax=Ajellomyces dermatitidis (strain ER-3 / ATCC MYA-2586) TaxID=559297 RepID=A0ABX2VVS1_AJEDR|nr:uncharacterized protein BDCG_17003 [Blastomyces dermatitidis ER-3]OAT01251.1 hypothetical protein BDCG_17003 [Blastomyces dermatitidis ER-3]
MSFLFKYSAVLWITKARERCHRLKGEKKKMFKHRETDCKAYYDILKRLCKRQKLAEEKKIEVLFRSQMHSMIQDIEETALLSEHVNLLAAEVKPETADQEMQDFEVQIDLTERKQQKPFSEKVAERDFEVIIISDEEKKKKKKKKKKNEK